MIVKEEKNCKLDLLLLKIIQINEAEIDLSPFSPRTPFQHGSFLHFQDDNMYHKSHVLFQIISILIIIFVRLKQDSSINSQ